MDEKQEFSIFIMAGRSEHNLHPQYRFFGFDLYGFAGILGPLSGGDL
jgi:hypothetical protein